MHFNYRHYVPCLRWKKGEYDAIFALSLTAKNFMSPLIEVAEIGFDFETNRTAKTVDQHLAKFGKRLETKWRHRPCFVDLRLIPLAERMADGQHPIKAVFDQISSYECSAVPVTGLSRDPGYQQAVSGVIAQQQQLCIRLNIEEASKRNLEASVDSLLRLHAIRAQNTHLILDLGAPNFLPVDSFAKLIQGVIEKLPYLADWQTFTLLGTAFPSSMAEVTEGVEKVQRSEWVLYKTVATTLMKRRFRVPTFGDYGIQHPDVVTLDMRVIKPSASIRYTADDSWLIVKGRNTRDYGLEQYKQLCSSLTKTPGFLGPRFSFGDEYIERCATGSVSTGTLTTWRQVGTNHHIEKVVRDIASFFDSLGAE